MIDAANRLDARQSAHTIEQLPVEDPASIRVRFLRSGDRHHHREHIVRIESRVDRLERQEAANHQPRSNQQHQRQREFGCDQKTTQTVAAYAVAAAAPALFQRAGQVHRGSLHRWGQSKRQRSSAR